MNDFQLELAQDLIDQIESSAQQKKVMALVVNPKSILRISINEYFVKSSENRFKVYRVFFSLHQGWICECKWYLTYFKKYNGNNSPCAHIIACRIYQILYHDKKR